MAQAIMSLDDAVENPWFIEIPEPPLVLIWLAFAPVYCAPRVVIFPLLSMRALYW